MSKVTVTTVDTANATTDHTITTGNTSGSAIVIPASGSGIVLQGNSTSNTIIANSTQVTIKSGVGLSANGSLGTNGQVLTSNASSLFWSTVAGANVQTFSTSGTWTKPGAGTVALIQCWGGGGSGGGNGGGGGGGGGYNQAVILLSTLGSTETVTVGAGGVVSNTSNSGSSGGTTTFGSWVAAYGGSGGATGTSGAGGGGGNPFAAPFTVSYASSFNFATYSQSDINALGSSTEFSPVTTWSGAGRLGQGSGSGLYCDIVCSTLRYYDAVEGVGLNGFGGGGGSQLVVSTASGNKPATRAVIANTSTGNYEVIGVNNASLYPRTGARASGGGAGGGGAGRNTGAVYAGGVGTGSGGAGANATTAAVGGTAPGGGGGGGSDGASNKTSGAGANGMCVVIVI